MQHSFFNFLRSALVPVLRADISARAAGNVHFGLIAATAFRTFPDKFAVFIGDDFNFTVVAAILAIVAFGVEFGVHNVVVNVLDNTNNRGDIVLHIRHFYVTYRAAGAQLLEFRFEFKLAERIDRLGNVHVITVGYIVFIGNPLDYAEAFLKRFSEFISGAFKRSAV